MILFVKPEWLEEQIDQPRVTILDPRPPINYFSGHVKGAINLPMLKLLDASSGGLLPVQTLEALLSSAGVNAEQTVVIYDAFDGQRAALLAWALDYLGHPNIRILSTFIEGWILTGREVFYRPVKPKPSVFKARLNPQIRATWQDVQTALGTHKILDMRSSDEYHAKSAMQGRPGHIPKATNLPWLELLEDSDNFLKSEEKLAEILSSHSVHPSAGVITYCATGPRACVGYISLKKLGFSDVRVYDRSFTEWSQRMDLPVEVNPN